MFPERKRSFYSSSLPDSLILPKPLLFCFVLVLVVAGTARAGDVVHLKDGSTIEGRVEEGEEKVKIHRESGSTITVDRSQVRRIEYEKKKSEGQGTGTNDQDSSKKQPEKHRLFHVYRYELEGFSLLIPPGWHRGKGAGDAYVSFYHRKGPAKDTVRVDLFTMEDIGDLKKAARSLQNGYRGGGLSYNESFFRQKTVDGQEAIEYRGSYTSGGIRMIQNDLVVLRKNRLTMVSAKGRVPVFRDEEPRVSFVLNSLKVFSPPELDEDTRTGFLGGYRRGSAYLDEGRLDRAVERLQSAARTYPFSPRVHRKLASAHRERLEYQKAIREMKVRFQNIRTGPVQYNRLGKLCYRAGRYEEAVANLKKAISLNDRYFRAHENLSVVEFARGNLMNAVRHARRMKSLREESGRAHFMLGVYYTKLKKLEKAEEHLQTVLEQNPDHEEARQFLKRVQVLKKD